MIHKVFPLLNDFENLSRLKVETSEFANSFDFKNVVVNKPWGYEYLWFQNETVAIWFLYIKGENETSLHCHARKRTSLIVLDGVIQCTTLDDKYKLNRYDAVVLEPCVFHSSKAISTGGAYLMEIETPPSKGDLIRMNDAYGRQNNGYEKSREYSTDLDSYLYHPFDEKSADSWKFRDTEIKLSRNKLIIEDNTEMIVPVSGNIKFNGKIVIESGEAVSHTSNIPFNDVQNTDYMFLIFNKIPLNNDKSF